MKSTPVKIHWSLWLIGILNFVFSLAVYSHLPEQIATHWNFAGEVDGYSSRLTGAFGLPILNLVLLFLMKYLPAIDPRKQNYEKFKSFYGLFVWIMVLFLTGLHLLIITWALGYQPNISLFVKFGLGILLIVLGNYLGKVRPNWFYGIKTPWTLENEVVWIKTHRLGGPLMFGAGLITLCLAFVNHPATFGIVMAIALLVSFIPIVYSYWLYRHLN